MNFRSKLIAVAGSALILASSITGGSAAETADASVSITTDPKVNVLSVGIAGGDFDDKSYSFANQFSAGSLTVSVTDLRGTAPGWKVNLSAGDFSTGGASAKSFSVNNLTLTPGAATASTSFSDASGITPAQPITVSSTAKPILTAAAGMGDGQFSSTLIGVLTIPGGTLVGDYTSTVMVSIDEAP